MSNFLEAVCLKSTIWLLNALYLNRGRNLWSDSVNFKLTAP